MTAFDDILRGLRVAGGEELSIDRPQTTPFVAVDPRQLHVRVAADASAQLVVMHTQPLTTALRIELSERARLEVIEIFTAEAFAEVVVSQASHSICRMTSVQLASANASYRVELNGAQAESTLNGVFLAGGEEHCLFDLRTNHNFPDCRSSSFFKGVAGGNALGEFRGMVYVAPDAQRTDAFQQSRNILLGDTARILTRPQLEIYADDVKCSHGATVGQIDTEAILYMRQRGLDEQTARGLQIEGFVGEVVMHCGVEGLCEAVMALASAKMKRL